MDSPLFARRGFQKRCSFLPEGNLTQWEAKVFPLGSDHFLSHPNLPHLQPYKPETAQGVSRLPGTMCPRIKSETLEK